MPSLPPNIKSYIVEQVGMGGINSFDDPSNIADIECVDILNMVQDNGVITPRQGSLLYADKPTGETASPFQMLVATNSNGVDFMIMNYGLNFYLRYMGFWLKINQTYTPSTANLYYGSANWNKGITDDRFYFGNGQDDTIKWVMGVGVTTQPFTGNASTLLTVSAADGRTFPASGSVVMVDPVTGDTYELVYTANDGNGNLSVFSNTVGFQTIPPGMLVAMQIQDMADIPKGKILNTYNGRLLITNSVGAENTIQYSVLGDPELYTVSADPDSGGFYVITDGKGPIINIDNFGAFLVIEKEDTLISFNFQYAADNTGFIIVAPTIMSGDSVGPVSQANTLNYMNTLYYTTLSEGIISFSPVVTGTQTSPTLGVLSQKIQNYVTDIINFTNGRATGFNQKLFWVNSVPLLQGVPDTINNEVLVYDLIRSIWTRIDNWNAADMKPVNNVLYYVSLNDGAVYECYVDYQDAQEGNPLAYTASFTTKRFDMDNPQALSKGGYIYIQGYINQTTKFYVDVLFNENGYLGKQTYEIDGDNSVLVQNNLIGGMGAYAFGIPLLGGVNLATMQNAAQPGFFRAYLQLSQAYQYSNIQVRGYSQDLGSYWGVTKLVPMFFPSDSIATSLVIGPTNNPPIII